MNDAPSPYLAYFGLTREPFGDAQEYDLFYPEPTRKQRLDILLHLTQYSQELLLVIGPEGSGKSALLQQFIGQASDGWKVARIEAKPGIDERNLIQQCYHQLELNFQGASHNELLEHLEHYLDSLVHQSRQGVMLVDDAHLLPATALRRVLELAKLRSFTDKPLLRVVLFGESPLLENLSDPQLEMLSETPRRVIDLPPMDAEHTGRYIQHRLLKAQFVASEPFTDAAIHKLYKQSGGWPGRINTAARKLLLDSLPAREKTSLIPGLADQSLYKPGRLIAAGVFLLLLALLLFQRPINDFFTPPAEEPSVVSATEPEPQAPQSERHTQELALPALKSEQSNPAPKPADKPAPATMDEAIAAITASSQDETEDSGDLPIPPLDVPTTTGAEPEEAPANLVATEAVDETPQSAVALPPAAQTVSQPIPAAKSQPAPVVKTKPALPITPKKTVPKPISAPKLPDWLPAKRNAWLLKQAPERYTLQMVAGEKLDTLQQFLAEHKLDIQQLAYYQTTRKGKPWHALVYGLYPDKQAAIDARSQMPRSLQRLKPWVRDMGGIQQNLSATLSN